jgi:hypothetical protein
VTVGTVTVGVVTVGVVTAGTLTVGTGTVGTVTGGTETVGTDTVGTETDGTTVVIGSAADAGSARPYARAKPSPPRRAAPQVRRIAGRIGRWWNADPASVGTRLAEAAWAAHDEGPDYRAPADALRGRAGPHRSLHRAKADGRTGRTRG